MASPDMKILSFERGIERVVTERGLRPARPPDLPGRPPTLVPIDQQITPHLDELFLRPSLDNHILTSLKVDIQDTSILLPSVYYNLFSEVRKVLKKAAEKAGPLSDKKALKDALDMFEQDHQLMALLEAYRTSLFRG